MEFTQKIPSLPNDFSLMVELANRFREDSFHVSDLPYRFSSWALDDPENACLWCDANGNLLAWAVMQTPFWTVDLVLNPQFARYLFPRILTWIDQRARAILDGQYGHSAWYVPIFSEQSNFIRVLEKAGYVCQSFLDENAWSKVWMERNSTALSKKYPLPSGFTIRPLRGENEVPSYVNLHQETFETKNMTIPWRLKTTRQSAYVSDFDLVIEAPDGRLGAFCIAWINEFDPQNRIAQIEPLGCHPDFRHLALGRVILAAMLDRLIDYGIHKINVETDGYRDTAFRLYQSLGFEVKKEILIFRKDF